VIATDWGGPADYLGAETGFLIPPERHEGLVHGFATAMQRLVDDPELAARMGEAARKKMLAHFTWQMKIDRIVDIYKSVIESAGVAA
jgi:glycosyltransferase involved in cell wall biosynthesis